MKKLIFITLAIATTIINISCIMSKKDLYHSNDPIIAYLDSINSYINLNQDSIGFLSIYHKIDIDTLDIYGYPMYMKDVDDECWGIIGNFINSLNIYALVTNPKDSTISFYHKQNDTWIRIGSDKIDTE